MIPYGKQTIDETDIQAVVETLRSDFLTQGPKVPEFESELKKYTNANHAVCVNSATSALHIACLSLGLGENDVLWTSPISFVASANCARYCGAQVEFIDVDMETYNICVEKLESQLVESKILGNLPKVIVVVHLGGLSCDMKRIHHLSKLYGFSIIEDASHAIGGLYEDKKVGSCEHSDISIFSFHPVKIITSAEGGVALTNNSELASRMRKLRSHGVTKSRKDFLFEPDGEWYYEQHELGFNYRMTDLQAALGLSQLRKVDVFVDLRNKIAARYHKLLAETPLHFQSVPKYAKSSFHLFIVLMSEDTTFEEHRRFFTFLQENDIQVNITLQYL